MKVQQYLDAILEMLTLTKILCKDLSISFTKLVWVGWHMVHSMNFVSVKMHDPPKNFFFAWNWWNTSQWHPITWIWPLECSRKSQFWRSLKWHSLCTVKVASKNCLSGLHFLELWLVSYHFGNLQSRPSKAH